MAKNYRRVYSSILVFSAWAASSAVAQPPQPAPSSIKAVHVIGIQGIKQNTKGRVTVLKDGLEFVSGATKGELSIASMQDALTGADSQRLVGGTIGALTNLAPYGSGRFLSLFRTKIDTLTIAYRDSDGGLHGAILTVPQGQAAVLKKQLIEQGAKTSSPAEDEANQQTNTKKEKKQ